MDVLTIAAGKAWALLVSVFPMFFGVAISLNVNSEKTSHMSNKQIISAFFFGVGISYYFSHFVAETWIINPLSFTFITMEVVVAAIGMSVMAQIIASVPEQIIKIINTLRTKFIGGE